jgi:hypothetical protein
LARLYVFLRFDEYPLAFSIRADCNKRKKF